MVLRKSVAALFLTALMASVTHADVAPVPRGHTAPRNHGYALSGVIVGVNPKTRLFRVRGATGKSTTLLWTGATNVTGGELATGRHAEIRWLMKDGRKIATSIKLLPVPAVKQPGTAP